MHILDRSEDCLRFAQSLVGRKGNAPFVMRLDEMWPDLSDLAESFGGQVILMQGKRSPLG
ncbi:hypothetical protein J3O30_00345 [Rhizobium sp. NZLR1]|nr:hypothetical protein J3O30_00345 [Rhizobium sp. NZLR1]